MRTMKRITAVPLALILALMIGCAQFGLPVPETFNQKLIAGYATVTSVRTTTTMLLDTDVISADDGENIAKGADAARAGLDVARKLSKTDMIAAEGKLSAVRTALVALQSYLALRSK